MCRSDSHKENNSSTAAHLQTLAVVGVSNTSFSLSKSCFPIKLDCHKTEALLDSGSTSSFIHPMLVEKFSLTVNPWKGEVSMACASRKSELKGYCVVNIVVHGIEYSKVQLFVLSDLCKNIILGQDWQSLHDSVTIKYGPY